MNQVLEASLLPPECPIAGSWIGRRVAGIWIRHSSISCWCPKCHLITALYSIDDVVGNDLATVALDTSCESSKNPLLNEKKKKNPSRYMAFKNSVMSIKFIKRKTSQLALLPYPDISLFWPWGSCLELFNRSFGHLHISQAHAYTIADPCQE